MFFHRALGEASREETHRDGSKRGFSVDKWMEVEAFECFLNNFKRKDSASPFFKGEDLMLQIYRLL